MTAYECWRRYGTFLAINIVVISVIVQLIVRGAWTFSGFAILALVVADLFVGRLVRRKSEQSGQVYPTGSGRGFFRLYGYALAAGALIWLALRIKEGISWVDFAPFAILMLLAVAMLSIAKRMNSPTGPDQEELRSQGRKH